MSQGIVGKDGIGYAKADVAESKTFANAYKGLVAVHKSPGGETAINLLNLTAPGSDMPGFSQPSAAEIQAARPYMIPSTFRLMSSSRGRLLMYSHFVVTGTQINFTTSFGTTQVNELFWIECNAIPANNLLVSDGRQFDTGSFVQAQGNATVNVGYSFQQSDFLVVVRNNQILDEGIDFTRVIGTNGTGSTLTLTLAPTDSAGDNMRVYGGIFFGNASTEYFTQLERVQGALNLLAADAAAGFYGDTNAARYLTATPAEIDRLAFGTAVTTLQSQVASLVATPVMAQYYLSANFTSSATIPINFDVKDFDIYNNVTTSATAWKFTATSPGYYQVMAHITGLTSATYTFGVYKNGTFYRVVGGDNTATALIPSFTVIQLSTNDFIDIRANTSVSVGGGTPAAGSFSPSTVFIRKIA